MHKGMDKLPITKRDTMMEDFHDNFVPTVHKIGFWTQLIAIFMTILPVVYFLFIKGYSYDSPAPYISYLIMCYSMCMGMYLSEPLTYWPLIGSAGTYMSYLSGNASTIRAPVAISVQNSLEAPVDTPKGQIVTIISIAVSIIINILFLLGMILFGGRVLDWIPEIIRSSFSFVSVCVFGTMLSMRLTSNSKGELKEGVVKNWVYLLVGAVCYWIWKSSKMPAAGGPLITLGVCFFIAYIQSVRRRKER